MRHVVWDWNGTLFDDQHLVVDAVSAALVDAGLAPITLADYQRLYCRPVQVFYARLFGRELTDHEWNRLDDAFHDAYAEALAHADLADDALHALDRVEQAGLTQSLLSMYRHHELLPLVSRLGIDGRFVRIDGLDDVGGGRKAPYLETHLERVADQVHTPLSEILLIGDALDDAHAAEHVGARCVLYDGGSHPRNELETAGVPVVSSLVEALEAADVH
jgi:phosphoglycolate phosphatase-like HAD superfamily hydrolase